MPEIGQRVDDLLGVDHLGQAVHRSDYPGKRILLYFYPKDNTAGCTKQACSLRDGYDKLREAGVVVVGVSKDSARSHKGFIERHGLPFRLIVDTNAELAESWGVWREKTLYGRKYMGVERTSFVISPEGIIEHIVSGRAVDTHDHAHQILALIRGQE